MNLKRIVGSHFANYREAWEANRLVDLGMIHPILTRTYALDDVGEATYAMHTNSHTGKLGVLVNAHRRGPRRPGRRQARALRERPRRLEAAPLTGVAGQRARLPAAAQRTVAEAWRRATSPTEVRKASSVPPLCRPLIAASGGAAPSAFSALSTTS